ncbi:hypothetical protein ACF053_30035 [Streptomyces kanasensis]|uniref:hypothetical protein n=1 Tax=Streptomyces kanasensis TaxID=936756 RepID=UPI003702EC19
MTAPTIIPCTSPTELYRRFQGHSEPQPAYLELDLRAGTLHASYNAEVGNARPSSVVHGFDRRYPIPVLHGEAANRVMEAIAPHAARICADWEQKWDGNNLVARLGADAQDAEAQLMKALGLAEESPAGQGQLEAFAADDVLVVWDVDGAVNGSEADDYDITADTTDERLDEIAREITAELAQAERQTFPAPDGTSVTTDPVVFVDGLDAHLRELRDGLSA